MAQTSTTSLHQYDAFTLLLFLFTVQFPALLHGHCVFPAEWILLLDFTFSGHISSFFVCVCMSVLCRSGLQTVHRRIRCFFSACLPALTLIRSSTLSCCLPPLGLLLPCHHITLWSYEAWWLHDKGVLAAGRMEASALTLAEVTIGRIGAMNKECFILTDTLI